MLKSFLTVFLVLIVTAGKSQVIHRCLTVEKEAEYRLKEPELTEKLSYLRTHSIQSPPPEALTTDSTLVIPVVVHVVYNSTFDSISMNQIHSQIDVLNEDFGRYNPDASNTPAAFLPYASTTGVYFCLATRKPNGDWTNGVEYKYSSVQVWNNPDDVKLVSQGGLAAWDPDSYLNIWVCRLDTSVLGLAYNIPGDFRDGIVVSYNAFGRTGILRPFYNKGRTTTHEVGHYFNAHHIWGDDGGGCMGTDSVADTPNQANATYTVPAFPKTDSCTPTFPGIMFMNFMDYTDDVGMNMFTQGQATKIRSWILTARSGLLTSLGCAPPISVPELRLQDVAELFPNPANEHVYLRFTKEGRKELFLFDCFGRTVWSEETYAGSIEIPTVHLSQGMYFISVTTEQGRAGGKVLVQR